MYSFSKLYYMIGTSNVSENNFGTISQPVEYIKLDIAVLIYHVPAWLVSWAMYGLTSV